MAKTAKVTAKKAVGMPCSMWAKMTDDNKHFNVRINMAKWFAKWLGGFDAAAHAKMLKFYEFFVNVKATVNATSRLPRPLELRYLRKTSEMLNFVGKFDMDAKRRADACL